MGRWGMGLTQSDEFLEIYDNFMSEYDEGKPVSEITDGILNQYHEEFDDNDGIMHDVYFALAKAEWMCGAQSDKILARVKVIIDSGANIEFLRSLEASEKDLREREKALLKFLNTIIVPRKAPRKRQRPKAALKELPEYYIGECYRYKFDNGYRVFVVLDRKKPTGFREMMFCAILSRTFSAKELYSIDISLEKVLLHACFAGEDFPGKSTVKKIGEISVPDDIQWKLLGENGIIFGSKELFRTDKMSVDQYTLDDLIQGKVATKSQVERRDRFIVYHL